MALGALVSLSLVAAACGDDDDDDASPSGTEPATVTSGDAAPEPTDAPEPTEPTTPASAETEPTEPTGTEPAGGGSVPAGSAADCDVPLEDGDPNAEMRFLGVVPPRQFDPHKSPSIVGEYSQLSVVYDRLLEVRAGPVLCPLVAESWEFNDDGTELTMHLDPEAVFWDGSPIDAAAVKANLDRARELPESTVKSFLSMVTAVEVVDPQTVTVVANRPAGDLPSVLSGLVGAMVNPTAFADPAALAASPAGSGPYELTDLVIDSQATYTRRDDYWNESSAGKAKTLVYIAVPVTQNRFAAFQAGDGDLAFFSLSAWGDFNDYAESTDGVSITKYPYGGTLQIFLNTDRPPLDNQLVRQALNHAINRDEINEAIMFGECPATTQMLQPVYPGHIDELDERYPYDPDKARELLAEAGVADGFSFEIGVGAGLSPQVDFAQIVQAQLADIGVNVTVTEGDLLEINPRFGQGELDALSSTRLADVDPGVALRNNYTQGSRFPGALAPEVTDAINATLDPTVTGDDRTALLEEANSLVTEQALDIWICATASTFIHTDDVVNADLMGVPYFYGVFDMRYVNKT